MKLFTTLPHGQCYQRPFSHSCCYIIIKLRNWIYTSFHYKIPDNFKKYTIVVLFHQHAATLIDEEYWIRSCFMLSSRFVTIFFIDSILQYILYSYILYAVKEISNLISKIFNFIILFHIKTKKWQVSKSFYINRQKYVFITCNFQICATLLHLNNQCLVSTVFN